MTYADDTQIYFCFNSQDMASTISRIEKCIADMRSWMVKNKLMLNDSKTEILHLTSRFVATNELLPVRIGDTEVTSSSHVRDLGVILDENMTMSQHVSSICRNASFALYNIGKLRAYLDQPSTEKLVHAFVSSRLDGCNSLLYGLPDCEVQRLQRVQNAAARLVTRVKGRASMDAILRQLHWLPIRKRILFKILLLTFKAMHGLAPQYITDMLSIRTSNRHLRSSTHAAPLLQRPLLQEIRTATW